MPSFLISTQSVSLSVVYDQIWGAGVTVNDGKLSGVWAIEGNQLEEESQDKKIFQEIITSTKILEKFYDTIFQWSAYSYCSEDAEK